MSAPKQRPVWCDTCRKATHDTKDCWGLGTVAVRPEEPSYRVFVRDFKSPHPKPKR